jgi:hypothetical protein
MEGEYRAVAGHGCGRGRSGDPQDRIMSQLSISMGRRVRQATTCPLPFI